MRKGVSIPIIIILVLLITVSLILISYNWLLRYSSQIQWEIEKSLEKKEGCLRIENIDAINGKITIRNCGSIELRNFKAYLDSEIVVSDDIILKPGEIREMDLTLSDGDHEIYISSDNAVSPPILINVFSYYCTGTQPPNFGDWLINDDTNCYCMSGRNITLTGNLRVYGSGSFSIDNCIIWLNQTGDWQYQFTFNDTSRTTITNSILNSSYYFYPYWRGNSVNYFENVIFVRPHSGSHFEGNSINTFVSTQFIRQVVFDQNSKSTIINSRKVYSEANSLLIYGASPELTFQNSETIDWEVGSTDGIIKGNYTTTGIVKVWEPGRKVTRYFPTIVKHYDGSPVTGIANITNKYGGLVWQGNIVNGYTEPVITFNNTTYGSGNFTLYVTDGSKTISKDINFLTNTSISLTIGYCDYFIFNPSDTYTIYDSNKVYCLGSNINIAGKNAINFAPGVQNTTLDCQGYSINGSQTANTNGVTLSGGTTMYDRVTNCIITNFYRGIYIYAPSIPNIKYINVSNSIINNNTYGMYTYNSVNITFINNTASNNLVGFYLYITADWGTYINNTIKNNYEGLRITSQTNNITGGSVSDNSGWDYYLDFVHAKTYFTNTNFTGSRKIYFNNTPSWFNYNNETDGNIFLYTYTFITPQQKWIILTRNLKAWSQNLMQWNDSSSGSRTQTMTYNITGLIPNIPYYVYNRSVLAYTINSGPDGKVIFDIDLLPGQIHEIKVEKPAFDGVLWFKFNEGNGTNVFDSSLYQNNGIYYGESFGDGTLENQTNGYVVRTSNGKFNKALYFKGATSNGPRVNLPLTQSLNITQPFTIAAWINVSNFYSSPYSQPIIVRTGGYGHTGLFVRTSGALSLGWGNYSDASRIDLYGGSISLNNWQYVTATYDESGLATIYINGNPVGSVSKNVTNYADALGNRFRIGYYWSGEPSFNGTIDEIRIWNRSLSQAEIQAEMQSSMPMSRPIASYRFEEPDSATYANDTHIWVNGTYGSALSFDGLNDYTESPDQPSLDVFNLTITAWVKFATNNINSVILQKIDYDVGGYLLYVETNGVMTLDYSNDTDSCWPSSNSLTWSKDTWYFVSVTHNSNTGETKFYRNGNSVGGSAGDSSELCKFIAPSTKVFRVAYSSGIPWNGAIDEVRIWNRVLSQSEIQAEMNKG